MGVIKKMIYSVIFNNKTVVANVLKRIYYFLRGNRFAINGNDNTLDLQCTMKGTKIHISGNNNQLEIRRGASIGDSVVTILGNNNRIIIGKDAVLISICITEMDNSNTITIGEQVSAQRGCAIISMEGNSLTIGDRCMLAYNIELRNSDSHSIIDNETGRRLNSGGSISIGKHCWIAQQCLITKNVSIADDCVIGAKSLVNKSCEKSGTLYAGIPAQCIRTGISWRFERT